MKLFNYVKVIALFLLFLIPLVYLYNYCDRLELRNNKISDELIKEQLLNEMNNFQDDLKPENYVKSAFKDLEKVFQFPDLNNSQYDYTFSEEDKPNFIDKDFIQRSKAFLKEKYGFEPFIFVSSGFDFSNTIIDDKESVFKSKEIKEQFLQACLINIIYKNQVDMSKLKACLNDYNYFFDNKKDQIISILKNIKKDNLHNIDFYKAKYISIFSKKLEEPEKCIYFFSNVFGNQNIYQYYNLFIKSNSNKNELFYNFLGLYYILVKSTDFNIEKIIEKACSNNSNRSYNIKRNISNKKVDSPRIDYSGRNITYCEPFPFYFYIFIEKHKTKSEEIYKKYIEFIDNHSLEISIDKAYIKNYYSEYKSYIKLLIWVNIFIFLLYLTNVFFEFIKIDLSLSLRIRFTVLLAITIPIIGLWLIVNFSIKNEEKNYLTDVEKLVSERFNLLDKIKDDIVNGLTFDLLEHKKIIEDEYFKDTPEKFISRFSEQDNKKNNQIYNDNIFELDKIKVKEIIKELFTTKNRFTYVITNFFYIINRDGNNLLFNKVDNLGKKSDMKLILPLYIFLRDLNLLDLSSKENRKNEETSTLFNSFAENYFSKYKSRNILARENILIPSEKVALISKVIYQLIASPDKPNIPCAGVYNYMNMKGIMRNRLNKLITNNYAKFLEQNYESVQIKYAIFERDYDQLFEKIPQSKSYPFYQIQKEAGKIAVQRESSGSELIEKNDYYYLKAWKYYKDNPIIFTGVAIIPKNKLNLVSIKVFSLILIIYAILSVVLLSDFFLGALLEPLKSLFKFVNEISQGHINLSIKMETGDELEDLSYSLNKMSVGLCEREKLKRFVSDKLFSSLNNSKEHNITKAKVTILSSDIRSFTTISEKNTPEDVVTLLNDYFTLMEKSIVKYGGSIEKIVGDAISASFYEENNSKYAINACKAALEMRENLKYFNQERIAKGKFPIENGIGLASGEVMIGFAGKNARRKEFLLIGNIIKHAERLESMTKIAVSSKVFIDEHTFEIVKNDMSFCEESKDSEVFYREIKIEAI